MVSCLSVEHTAFTRHKSRDWTNCSGTNVQQSNHYATMMTFKPPFVFVGTVFQANPGVFVDVKFIIVLYKTIHSKLIGFTPCSWSDLSITSPLKGHFYVFLTHYDTFFFVSLSKLFS